MIKLVLRTDKYFFCKVFLWISDSGNVFRSYKTLLSASYSFGIVRIILIVSFVFIIDQSFLFVKGGNWLNFKTVVIFISLLNLQSIMRFLLIFLVLLSFLFFYLLQVKFILVCKLRNLVHSLIIFKVWMDFLFSHINLLFHLIYECWLKLIAYMTVCSCDLFWI